MRFRFSAGSLARAGARQIDAQSCESLFAVVDFDTRDENLYLFDGEGRALCAGISENKQDIGVAAASNWISGGTSIPSAEAVRADGGGTLHGRWASALYDAGER